jgi:hypothetical protein
MARLPFQKHGLTASMKHAMVPVTVLRFYNSMIDKRSVSGGYGNDWQKIKFGWVQQPKSGLEAEEV